MPASQLVFPFDEPRLPWLPAPEPVRASEPARAPTDLDVDDWMETHGLRKVTPTRKGWLAAVEIVSCAFPGGRFVRTVDGVTLARVLKVEDEGHARSVMLSGGTEPVTPHRNFHRVLVIRGEWQPEAEYVLAASGPGRVWPDAAALIVEIEAARSRGWRAAAPKLVLAPPPAPAAPHVPSLPAVPTSPEAFGLAALGRVIGPEDCLRLMYRQVVSAMWLREPHDDGNGYAATVSLDMEMWDGLAATIAVEVTVPRRPADGDLVHGTDWRHAVVRERCTPGEGGPFACRNETSYRSWLWYRTEVAPDLTVDESWQGPPRPEWLTDVDNDRVVLDYERRMCADEGVDVEQTRQLYLRDWQPNAELIAGRVAWDVASRGAWPGLVAAVERFLPHGPPTPLNHGWTPPDPHTVR